MPKNPLTLPSARVIAADIAKALAEDVGSGDATASLIPADTTARARLLCREEAVLCGRAWFEETFRQCAPTICIQWFADEGDYLSAEKVVCEISGPAREMLTAERTALNFLQTLSGTATLAHRYAEAVKGTPARILDTRKTLPGLRDAQKYAVRCGGCHNQRMGLYDGILIKENHIAAAGSISAAVNAARRNYPALPVQVEVENKTELEEAINNDVPLILLDNFTLSEIRDAVQFCQAHARTTGSAPVELEASGNVDLHTIRKTAETGVQRISVGRLTKDVRAIDFSLRFY